jgi:rSAM/selenodomain-associated transferase 1
MPGSRLGEFCQHTGAQLVAQRGNDLGERMWQAIRDVSFNAADRIVLIGSDCPGLQRADVRAAFAVLGDSDVALTPTRDGGYCLIGMHGTVPAVFDGIAWGQSTVAEQTRQRCATLGLTVAELQAQADIDFAGDWAHWCAQQSGRELAEYAWEMSVG